MASERKIRRYAAYFQGWATAFGNHDKDIDRERDLQWLYGEDQIGLILTPGVKKFLYPRLLGHRAADAPRIEIGPGFLHMSDAEISFGEESSRVFETVMSLLNRSGDLHLLQTYHLVYPSGTRILTLTRNLPLPLVYREIEPLRLRLA
jgi:hypothetical protein